MNILLFGFKGCGKTTLGKQTAARLGRSFLDTDLLLEKLYWKQTGEKKSFREIFQTIGEERFRALESEVLHSLSSTQNTLIATGGGIILNPKNLPILAKLGQLVYLKVSKETLKKRILSGSLPAFLDPEHPEESFEKIYEERRKKYEEIPAVSIDLENKTQDQSVQELSTLIEHLEKTHGKQ